MVSKYRKNVLTAGFMVNKLQCVLVPTLKVSSFLGLKICFPGFRS